MDVVTSHLLDEDPENAWEPLFIKCGQADLLSQVLDHPTGAQVRALPGEPRVAANAANEFAA